ncbi:MAG: hypothetical protein ACI8RD_000840 [Bacillariaceae sp.]|jgi:hypothetical protein
MTSSREVNLSGNRRTGGNSKSKASSSSGRRDLLKNAEAQRKQRQERVRREKAAIFLQRVTRGYFSRLRTVQQCYISVLASSEPTSISSSSRRLVALSICLSHHSLLTKFDTNRTDLLLGFQKNAYKNNNDNNDNNHNNHNTQQNNDPQPMDVDSFSGSWLSQKRMIINTLVEFDPYRNNNESNKKLYQLLETYRESTRIDDRIFLKLTKCMQRWYCYVDEHKTTTNPTEDDTEPPKYEKTLTKWAIEAGDRLKNPNAKALLATIILSSNNYNRNSNDCNTTIVPDQFEKWFTPLAEILLRRHGDVSSSSSKNSNNNNMDPILQATMENLRNTQVKRLLSNLLDLTKSAQLVLLINHVLCQPQNDDLKLTVSLLARGDSLVGKQLEHDPNQNNGNNNGWDDDSNDDDEDSEVEEEPSSQKKARGVSTQYKRQEILTLVKLDRLYNERIQQQLIKEQHTFDSATIEVATKIVKAPWKEWGLQILGVGTDNDGEKERYVETLGYLLQASSSMRAKTKFTPLSPLAFNHAILKGLWNRIQEQQQQCGVILTIFADLFSHYLVALSDDDFIKYHCNSFSEGGVENIIMAKDLVLRYGQVLHEVYWTKPVISNEIQMDNVRGRLILSGTKLWNSIYERWNRLVKTSFCEENMWWFPHMGSKEGDSAVIPDRELGHAANDDNDDDDDDDSMDIDEDQNQNQQLSTAEEATDALADSFRDPKMARVLTCIPQALPFQRRVKLFHSLLKADKQKSVQAYASRRALMAMRGGVDVDDAMMWLDGSVREQVTIRRATLYKDSMEQLNKLGVGLKHKSKQYTTLYSRL